jgi:hypothetical protein
MSRRRFLSIGAALLAVVVALGLYWFQPWKLWTDHRVNDALPAVATASIPPTPRASATARRSAPTSRARLLARGTFISHEHATSGTASVVQEPSGRRVLAIANLKTSDGPVVKVWLTDRRVTRHGWHVFDDGKYVSLGSLKGNLGNQLYPIPDDADLSVLRSVTIWCDRFDVSFGAAELVAVGAG